MPGLVPGIHVFAKRAARKTWMAGPSPTMTALRAVTTHHLTSLRRRLPHPLALCQRGDGGCSDRALLVVEKALADRDALGGMMVHHLEADPFLFRQAMQIQYDVAVDVAEALVAGVGEGTGEIRRHRDPHERRQRHGLDKVAHLAQPQPPRADGAHRACYRAGRPFAVHAKPRIGGYRNVGGRGHVPVRWRPDLALRLFRGPQQLPGWAGGTCPRSVAPARIRQHRGAARSRTPTGR